MLLAAACGDRGSDPGVQPGDPDAPVTSSPLPVAPDPEPSPSLVSPRPGQVDVRPIAWEEATAVGERRVELRFVSGVEPCNVLDSVEVDYRKNEVEITLFEGRAPSDEDVACIEIAVEKRTIVELEEPLGGRKIADGAERN